MAFSLVARYGSLKSQFCCIHAFSVFFIVGLRLNGRNLKFNLFVRNKLNFTFKFKPLDLDPTNADTPNV